MVFFALFVVPFLVAFVTFLLGGRRVIWQEFLVVVTVSAVTAGVSMAIIYHRDTTDVEILNGRITSKQSERVSCEHSYCCRWCQSCTTNAKGHRSCTTYCCSTCYRHAFDVDWVLSTTVKKIEISRIDSQGLSEPGRWTAARVGESVAFDHSYTNYIKAAPDSLFRDQGIAESFAGKLPAYPGNIYDYYRLNRLVTIGLNLPDAQAWNLGISEINGRVGGPKQANVVVVVTTESDKLYHALRQEWLGGKKNDIIAVIGVKTSTSVPTIEWARVMSWADSDIFNVQLRDDILVLGTLQRENVLQTIERGVLRSFQRKPMSDFAYLESSITPTVTEFVVALLINLAISIGAAVFVVKNDIGLSEYVYNMRKHR